MKKNDGGKGKNFLAKASGKNPLNLRKVIFFPEKCPKKKYQQHQRVVLNY
ncbi:MAG: hypothetical protein OS130_00005 [Thermodesulfobacteriota bacterium]|nr:MAG: hypothetical protein OS130_00005 [Thermodesulfobacteriota bacterium]